MSTEGPLMQDGAQCVAGVDMSNTASLAGPSGSGQFLAVKLNTAGRTLIPATSGGEAIYGILQNKPALGQAADVGFLGLSKAVAGAQCTSGDTLMTDTSGRLIPVTGTNHRVAQAVESASATGVVFLVMVGTQGQRTAT